ncbi:hypothetical protein TNCV_2556371 [Trichonephila clavipes]|nr:hypothetical protein TNCV_2556371 [Trichonephila clavipes]
MEDSRRANHKLPAVGTTEFQEKRCPHSVETAHGYWISSPPTCLIDEHIQLEDIQQLGPSVISPDLNSIEHVVGFSIGARRPTAITIDELKRVLGQESMQFPQGLIRNPGVMYETSMQELSSC